MDANGEVGLGHAQIGLRAQTHEAQHIGRVAAFSGLAARGDVETDGESREVAGARTAAQQDNLIAFQPQTFKQFLRLWQRQSSGLQIVLEIGQHVLVEAAKGEAAGVGLDLQQDKEEPDSLQGFAEIAGGMSR